MAAQPEIKICSGDTGYLPKMISESADYQYSLALGRNGYDLGLCLKGFRDRIGSQIFKNPASDPI